MTFIKTYLPELKELKERLKSEKWINFYSKHDVYMGPVESVDYLNKFLSNYYKKV